MQTKLTARDKFLLYVLGVVVVIAAVVYFVIMPAQAEIASLDESIETVQKSVDLQDDSLAKLDDTKMAFEEATDSYNERKSFFYPIMTADEVDKMLTTFETNNGLTVRELELIMPTSGTSIKSFKPHTSQSLFSVQPETPAQTESSAATDLYAEKAKTYAEQNGSYLGEVYSYILSDEAETDKAQATEGDSSVVSDCVYSVDVRMTLSGSRADLEKSIDLLYHDYPAIRITAYNWTEVNDQRSEDLSGNPLPISDRGYLLNINVRLYMADSADKVTEREEASVQTPPEAE